LGSRRGDAGEGLRSLALRQTGSQAQNSTS
jgi:hypothetical protein